jgi:hypothetical protein
MNEYLICPALPGLLERGSLVLTPPRHGRAQTAINVHDHMGWRAVLTHHPERSAPYAWEEEGCALVLAVDGEPITSSVDRLCRWVLTRIDYDINHPAYELALDTQGNHWALLPRLRAAALQLAGVTDE